MVAYELYWLNSIGECDLIGVLPERRKNPMRITKDSITNWGRMLVGDNVDSEDIIFRPVTIDCLSGRILWVDLAFNNN